MEQKPKILCELSVGFSLSSLLCSLLFLMFFYDFRVRYLENESLGSNSGRRVEYEIEINEKVMSHHENGGENRRCEKLRDGMLVIFCSKIQIYSNIGTI